MGIPAEVIMRWTGHKNYEAMRPYVKIVDELKREAMQRFDAMAGEIMGHDSGRDFRAERCDSSVFPACQNAPCTTLRAIAK